MRSNRQLNEYRHIFNQCWLKDKYIYKPGFFFTRRSFDVLVSLSTRQFENTFTTVWVDINPHIIQNTQPHPEHLITLKPMSILWFWELNFLHNLNWNKDIFPSAEKLWKIVLSHIRLKLFGASYLYVPVRGPVRWAFSLEFINMLSPSLMSWQWTSSSVANYNHFTE